MQRRAVIVGGGLGGLTCGALLARRGFRVTLLEKHSVAGGSATVFRRKGGILCETGLHEIDAIYDDPVKRRVFGELGLYDTLEFVRPREFFRFRNDAIDFWMPHASDEAAKALIERFPGERRGIGEYFRIIGRIYRALDRLQQTANGLRPLSLAHSAATLLPYRRRSVREVMDALFGDERLKLILNANLGYYHDSSAELSFVLHGAAQHAYFSGGGWYIRGGSQRLSDRLASVILAHGGRVVTGAEVTALDASSVTFRQGAYSQSLGADLIVSNLSPGRTARLRGEPGREPRPPGTSLFVVYLGFRRDLRELYGPGAYAGFFMEGIERLEDLDRMRERPVGERGFSFVDYAQIDSGLTPPGRSFGSIVTVSRIHEWGAYRSARYRRLKRQTTDRLIERLARHYPGIREWIDFAEGATPFTLRRYLGTPGGTAYGYAPTAEAFLSPPRIRSKRQPNLYYAGQWVLGGGFTPAIRSGWLAAEAIARRYG